MKHSLALFFLIFGLLPLSTHAQWAWIDKDGRKVFSDRAPPADVTDKSIFKRPGSSAIPGLRGAPINAVALDPDAKTSPPAKLVASSPKPVGVDKDLLERKQKAEQAQAEQRKAEQARVTKIQAENCNRARLVQKSLDSGVRMGRTNNQGEREVMDDAARAAEVKRIQSIIDSDCR